jgi:anaerobic nitric oxide reductase transcription regulator
MERLHAELARVAPSALPVLLLGETGVGKEVFATELHLRSGRTGPPIVVNYAAIPSELLEAELFGHVRGAFTGAVGTKVGMFEAAHRGTLFLDEVGELPLAMQAKLLRTLESGEVRHVGSTKPHLVDVRIISATNRNISKLVHSHEFRAYLYFRLNGVTVIIPPLRARRAEIAPLAEHFLRNGIVRHGRESMALSPEAIRALEAYEWPGNVRELRSTIERAVVLGRRPLLQSSDLMLGDNESDGPETMSIPSLPMAALTEVAGRLRAQCNLFEKEVIRRALQNAEGNQALAFRRLCLPRRTLISKLEL